MVQLLYRYLYKKLHMFVILTCLFFKVEKIFLHVF